MQPLLCEGCHTIQYKGVTLLAAAAAAAAAEHAIRRVSHYSVQPLPCEGCHTCTARSRTRMHTTTL
jgi:multimeric flavodoxin WrbA